LRGKIQHVDIKRELPICLTGLSQTSYSSVFLFYSIVTFPVGSPCDDSLKQAICGFWAYWYLNLCIVS